MAEDSFEKLNIQWFPGHMTKARRMIEENLKLVDAVCEILDARIPRSSRNPDIDRLAAGKPRLVILNRCDLADPAVTKEWAAYFRAQGIAVLETDARSGRGVSGFPAAVRELLKDKLNIAKITFVSGDNSACQEYPVKGTRDRCPCCGIALDENGVCPKCGCRKS